MSSLAEEHGGMRYDYILVTTIVLLTLLGLVTLYSASYLFALNQPLRFKRGWTPLVGNLLACMIMAIIFIPALALISLERLKKKGFVIFLVLITFILNCLPFIPFFQKSNHNADNDAMRWIVLKKDGIDLLSFQPSELIKVVLPIYLAYILDKNKDRILEFSHGFRPPLVITVVFCTLVFFQKNFSELLFISTMSIIICFVGGVRFRQIVLLIMLLIAGSLLMVSTDKEQKIKTRLGDFINGNHGYQITQSINAIESGGFWGKGIGQGTLKTRMPEVHGDFVFASYVEESGFLGVLLYLACFGFFVFFGYSAALRNQTRFGQILAFGLVTSLTIQTLINILVVAGGVPVTGVPLPFVSSGGTSLLMTLVSAALIVKISRQNSISGDMGRYYVG